MEDLHRVFISCDYRHDGDYRDKFLELNRYWNVFSKAYMRDDVSEHISSDRNSVLQDIRNSYIRDAGVLVLLCGADTRYCPFVDREVCSAMSAHYPHTQLGILVISLPGSGNGECPSREDRPLLHRDGKYDRPSTMYELSKLLPGVPMRIIDSIQADCPISVVRWEDAVSDHDRLVKLIDNAFIRRKTNRYDNSGQMKK